MAVWRLQVNTGGKSIAQYCIDNHVAAMGWSLDQVDENRINSIQSFADYEKLAKSQYDDYASVKRLFYNVSENDIIWLRSVNQGKYYFARVRKDSVWFFNRSAIGIDAANQLTNMFWYPASDMADEESVPGAITTAFIRGATLQKVNKSGIEAYSQLLFNRVHNIRNDSYMYPAPKLSLTESHFYSLLQPEDAEDLLALWLYDTKGYVCIPSTNKIATPKYECVLLDPSEPKRKHIYIQVKKGKTDLNTDDYADLVGDIYLLSTEGLIKNRDKYDNIFAVNPTDIFQFAINPDKAHIIPQSVLYWVKFLSEVENSKLESDAFKGIMFDTNISYSSTNENEMLTESKIAAYGDARRYVNSLKKGDYALFYSKGKGVIAIGEVVSEKTTDRRDERFHNVKMIVPKYFNGDLSELKFLSPTEIKVLLNKNFYWASTMKTPFLSKEQVQILIDALNRKYMHNL